MCSSCHSSFVKRVTRTRVNPLEKQKIQRKKVNKCNNKHLGKRSMRDNLKSYGYRTSKQRLVNFRLRIKLARLAVSRRSTKEKAAERARRGDIHAITESLHRAYDKGLITSLDNTVTFMRTVAENLKRDSHGHRQSSFSEKVYEVVRIWGGKLVADFVAPNLCGPSNSAQKRTRKNNIHIYSQENMNVRNFKYLASIYKDLKERHNIVGCPAEGP